MNIAETPWTIEEDEIGGEPTGDLCILAASPSFRMVASISKCYQGDRIPSMEKAHASLIAAAPELLAALQHVYNNISNDVPHGVDMDIVHAAVAKALVGAA